MKRVVALLSLLLLIGVTTGCNKKSVALNPGTVKNIAVLTLDGNLKGQTSDQQAELKRVLHWMDRDIIKNLKRSGYNAVLIKSKKNYKTSMGHLLIIDVDRFNPGNRAARAFVGFGAGSASLDLRYQLLNEKGAVLSKWEDGVGSSKGGTYCAQTLNRNAIKKLTTLLNG